MKPAPDVCTYFCYTSTLVIIANEVSLEKGAYLFGDLFLTAVSSYFSISSFYVFIVWKQFLACIFFGCSNKFLHKFDLYLFVTYISHKALANL